MWKAIAHPADGIRDPRPQSPLIPWPAVDLAILGTRRLAGVPDLPTVSTGTSFQSCKRMALLLLSFNCKTAHWASRAVTSLLQITARWLRISCCRWSNSSSMGNTLRHPIPPTYQSGPMQSMGLAAPGTAPSYERFDAYKSSMPMRKYWSSGRADSRERLFDWITSITTLYVKFRAIELSSMMMIRLKRFAERFFDYCKLQIIISCIRYNYHIICNKYK